MSYFFDGSNSSLLGQFNTALQQPVSIGIWFRILAHPLQADCMLQLNNDQVDSEDIVIIRTDATADTYQGRADALNLAACNIVRAAVGAWTPAIWISTNTAGGKFFLADQVNTSGINVICAPMAFIGVGETTHLTQDFSGWLAEPAVWDRVLTDEEAALYLAGNRAAVIAEANLRGYWPMDEDSPTHANLGLDTGGLLTVTGATFDADHPPILGPPVVTEPLMGQIMM